MYRYGVFLHSLLIEMVVRRIAEATSGEWGDLTRMTDLATVDLLVRLDAEERDAGLPPW